MAIIVEHDKRRHDILEKSLDVFATEGYEDVTFQKIADRCGITRTTLYIYFNNKRDIFVGSIKQVLIGLESELQAIIDNKELTAEQALRKMSGVVIDYCEQNLKMFTVLLPYLLQLRKAGEDPNKRIQRRIIRLRHHLSTVIIRGINNKEFKDLSVHTIIEMLYGQVESAIFRIAILNSNQLTEVRDAINLSIDAILS